ncbi:lipid-binding SYLF domain-containing protein [Phenylobacterium sp. LjRoot219]|uniref:lipid-binding SYLF domain-containing protein n=1 Tax=Phenylobacterium sp. LjRoot219 TaxID=3342283 RepID=UPI003ECF8FDD
MPQLPLHDRRAVGLSRRNTLALVAAAALARPDVGAAATATELSRDARLALDSLHAKRPETREWSKTALATMVFPKIVKAGVLLGGQGGDGALFVKGQPIAFYRLAAGSIGLQLGVQSFSYALFFMTQKALDYVKSSDGWSIGAGPTVVAMDEGKDRQTTSFRDDILSVAWGQAGLMAGLTLDGSKITKIHPKP